jgi:methylphosphotriester-DNA--protein-cysteine methyltransferase
MGMTVRAYVERTRIERAALAIRDGEKVEAVALEVGNRSKKNFYRQIRRRFGTTPAKYRSTHT